MEYRFDRENPLLSGDSRLTQRLRRAGEFLTDEQAESYGAFRQEPSRPELERFFFLDDADRRPIDAAASELGAAGHVLASTDKSRLSPVKDKHLNCLGR